MTPNELRSALFSVHDRLIETDIIWAVTASANLWLKGFDLTPGDLDILTDADGIYRIESIFESHVERPVQPPEIAAKDRIRSHFGALSLHGVECEFMGGVEHRRNGEWVPIDDISEHRTVIERGGREIPVMSPDYVWLLTESSKTRCVFGRAEIFDFRSLRSVMSLEHELVGYRDLGRTERVELLENHLHVAHESELEPGDER